jgi:hypothetical protein
VIYIIIWEINEREKKRDIEKKRGYKLLKRESESEKV